MDPKSILISLISGCKGVGVGGMLFCPNYFTQDNLPVGHWWGLQQTRLSAVTSTVKGMTTLLSFRQNSPDYNSLSVKQSGTQSAKQQLEWANLLMRPLIYVNHLLVTRIIPPSAHSLSSLPHRWRRTVIRIYGLPVPFLSTTTIKINLRSSSCHFFFKQRHINGTTPRKSAVTPLNHYSKKKERKSKDSKVGKHECSWMEGKCKKNYRKYIHNHTFDNIQFCINRYLLAVIFVRKITFWLAIHDK